MGPALACSSGGAARAHASAPCTIPGQGCTHSEPAVKQGGCPAPSGGGGPCRAAAAGARGKPGTQPPACRWGAWHLPCCPCLCIGGVGSLLLPVRCRWRRCSACCWTSRRAAAACSSRWSSWSVASSRKPDRQCSRTSSRSRAACRQQHPHHCSPQHSSKPAAARLRTHSPLHHHRQWLRCRQHLRSPRRPPPCHPLGPCHRPPSGRSCTGRMAAQQSHRSRLRRLWLTQQCRPRRPRTRHHCRLMALPRRPPLSLRRPSTRPRLPRHWRGQPRSHRRRCRPPAHAPGARAALRAAVAWAVASGAVAWCQGGAGGGAVVGGAAAGRGRIPLLHRRPRPPH